MFNVTRTLCSQRDQLFQNDEKLKPVMATLHRQFQEICRREETEQELRNDLKTVWDNHRNHRRLDINVKFSRQAPTPPLMLMPPGANDGPAVYASSPSWTTPNSYFVSLPLLPSKNTGAAMRKPHDDGTECQICMSAPATHAAIPCGHRVMCMECHSSTQLSDCPVCRAAVSSFIRIF